VRLFLGNFAIGVEVEVRDLWIGLYWTTELEASGACRRIHLYICLVPMLPIHLIYVQQLWRKEE